jgi:phosphatidylglycerophosphatase C
MDQEIAFFDFDGTITTRDTLIEFICHTKGRFRFYLGFILNSPWLIAFRAGILSNQIAKERILTWFFGGCQLDDFQRQCDDFATRKIPGLLRPKAMEEITKLRNKQVRIVIVSASPANWITGWAIEQGIEVVATRLEITKQQRLTGKIVGRNCHGEEKVCRIKESFDIAGYSRIYAYGDSSGDKPMLELGNISFFKPFR